MCNLQANDMDLRYAQSLESGQHQEAQGRELLQSTFPRRRRHGSPIAGGFDRAVRTTTGEPIVVQQGQCLDLLRRHLARFLLLALHLLKLRVLGLGSVIFRNPMYDESVRTAQKTVQPKEVESLERSQQPESDNIRE